MSVARKVLAGLFGGAKVGTEGLVRRKAEERARMERQQEQAADRELDLEMMRERQAAQRAAARRSTLEAKLDRKQRQEEQAALAASRMAEADYRAKSLANQQAAAESARLDRAEQRRFNNLNAVVTQFAAQQGQLIDALGVPFSDEKRRERLFDIAKNYGFSEEESNRLYGTLPPPAPVQTARDRFIEKGLQGYTEEELGRELNELVNLRDLLEKDPEDGGAGVDPGRRSLPPTAARSIRGGYRVEPAPYTAGGGTREEIEEHRRASERIAEIEALLSFGSRYGFDYVQSPDFAVPVDSDSDG